MVQKLRIAVVCSSNQNRSMEAHNFLSKRGFDVKSYGSGTHVKLPGSAPDKPNIYTFDTTYEEMYKDLLRRDSNLYPSIFFVVSYGFLLLKSKAGPNMTSW